MKIAILGTRGIPNFHGGFEQFAEYLSVHLLKQGHQVIVYNSHNHPYSSSKWNEVDIIHKYDPEHLLGTAGQFIYDLNCILDARKRDFDVILQLGYTSSSIWGWLFPKKAIVITNMDGLEWKRSKYSKPVQKFLRIAEKLAIKTSQYLVADSIGIQEYLKFHHGADSEYIAYGADRYSPPKNDQNLDSFGVKGLQFNLIIARMEPENNIEVILESVVASESKTPLLVIGKINTKFGRYLKNRYERYDQIRFLGGIYEKEKLNELRFWSNIYFHGHSVGGTNPSLLEAMAASCFIIAHDNVFNRSILKDNAYYFSGQDDLTLLLKLSKENQQKLIENNRKEILEKYSWRLINTQYEHFINRVYNYENIRE